MGDQVRQQQVPIIGEGQGVYSFVHVDDAAEATAAALDCPPGAYNIVDGNPSSQHLWLTAFARAAGAPVPPSVSEEEATTAFVVRKAARSSLSSLPPSCSQIDRQDSSAVLVPRALRDGTRWETERLRAGATIGLGRALLSRLTDGIQWRVLTVNTPSTRAPMTRPCR
jgi:nucleoside-diphosphate-sugar epimerase